MGRAASAAGHLGEAGESLATPEPVAADKPNAPRSRKGVQTRANLVAAAKAVFERSGFLDARISDIAVEAGLSHGSFYHYFESKEEIFREVAEAVEEKLSSPLGEVILDPKSKASPPERIREAIHRHMEAYRQEARIMGVIEQVSRYDEHMKQVRTERQRRYSEEVARSIRNLQRHGLADPGLDPVVATAVIGAMTSRFPELWFVEGRLDCDFEHGVEQLTRAFLNALGLEEDTPARRYNRR